MQTMTLRSLIGLCIGLVLGGAFAACSYPQQSVRVFGGRAELKLLAGEWLGEYASNAAGRNGTISFTLKAGTDSAYGRIVMIAPTVELPDLSFPDNDAPQITWRPVQTLNISFMVIDGNHVRGTLEPYLDPACYCTVTTLFDGILSGDVIAGTYSSMNSSMGLVTNGTWKVVRRSSRREIVFGTDEVSSFMRRKDHGNLLGRNPEENLSQMH